MKIKNVLATMVVALTFPLAKVTLASELDSITIGSEYEKIVYTEIDEALADNIKVHPSEVIGNDEIKYRLTNYRDEEYDFVFELFRRYCKHKDTFGVHSRMIKDRFEKSDKRTKDRVKYATEERRANILLKLTLRYSQCDVNM